MTHTWDRHREELIYEETSNDETQALISGELYARPTTPIEHTNYPDDYDLELNIGAEFKGEPPKQALIATGVKNYLIRPCNDAVFLKNISVDWISPEGHGQELQTFEITDEMIDSEEAGDSPPQPEEADVEQSGMKFAEMMLDAGEAGEGWLKNIIAVGAISLDEATVDLLVDHPNSPVDSEEELQRIAEEAAENWEDGDTAESAGSEERDVPDPVNDTIPKPRKQTDSDSEENDE
jgi:hypothetical protein